MGHDAGVISLRTGYALALAACAMFALNGMLARIAIDGGFSAIDVAAVRIQGAALLLLPFAVPGLRRVRRTMLRPILLYGVVGLVLSQGLYFQAVERIDIALALVIVYSAPLLVAVYQRVAHGERLPGFAYVAMVLAVIGVAVAVGGGVGRVPLVGLAVAVAAAVAFATQIVLSARMPAGLPPVTRAWSALAVAAAVWLVLVPPWSLPTAAFGAAVDLGGVGVTAPAGGALLWIVVLGGAIPYVLLLAGSVRIGAGAMGVIEMTQPLIGAAAAWLVLGQALSPLQVAGILLSVSCLVVVERSRLAMHRADVAEGP